ncbi:PTS sugar transporter subunit IIB [Erysipelothrix sp. HDW6C]|uniref:PTS system mannose/fructose/N-acetylgalactosamine-transporter subunit IIB n=1 Tax=Erysipelothrix sp. HDW6C TaxID=2714930 RepID=UPI00140BA7B2|nr:PTS sugar transporter subunit IIB [Erysipelothrix sp. HDW6C]QIK69840.1 PTS sugar transporter subunit IIB [Erysipelothrix sp. HDW6C]
MISLLRIDERLIHGQVAYAWTNAYKSQALMVITLAKKNDLERMSLELACPRDLKCFVVTVDEAIVLLNKYENRKIFVVTDSAEVVLQLLNAEVTIPSVNVGGLYHHDDRQQISKTVFVDAVMKDTFRSIAEYGTALEIRATPTDKEANVLDLI